MLLPGLLAASCSKAAQAGSVLNLHSQQPLCRAMDGHVSRFRSTRQSKGITYGEAAVVHAGRGSRFPRHLFPIQAACMPAARTGERVRGRAAAGAARKPTRGGTAHGLMRTAPGQLRGDIDRLWPFGASIRSIPGAGRTIVGSPARPSIDGSRLGPFGTGVDGVGCRLFNKRVLLWEYHQLTFPAFHFT